MFAYTPALRNAATLWAFMLRAPASVFTSFVSSRLCSFVRVARVRLFVRVVSQSTLIPFSMRRM